MDDTTDKMTGVSKRREAKKLETQKNPLVRKYAAQTSWRAPYTRHCTNLVATKTL